MLQILFRQILLSIAASARECLRKEICFVVINIRAYLYYLVCETDL